jgi:hypothetical protein
MHRNFIPSVVLTGLLAGSSVLLRAQTETAPSLPAIMPPGAVTVQTGGGMQGFQFVSGEPAILNEMMQVVKGAPFALEASIETVQALSDGNRIVHRQTVRLYRDSKGRTRREETLASIGPWAASGTPPTMITIQDPVSGASYFLDPRRKVADKLPALPTGKNAVFTRETVSAPVTAGVGAGAVAGGLVAGGESHMVVMGGAYATHGEGVRPEERSESLGKESVAGVSADGTRTTTTIPADAIGNERPIDIVRERWYSSDLQIVMRSKQADPRFGETTYEVTKLERAEPAASIFEIPSDYKVKEGMTHVFRERNAEPK